MKKLLSLLIVFVIILANGVFAENMDFSNASLDELLTIRETINDELVSRDALSYKCLYVGRYIVGEDIEPGKYVLFIKDALVDNNNVSLGKLYVDSEEHYDVYRYLLPNTKVFLTLNDDDSIEIEYIWLSILLPI